MAAGQVPDPDDAAERERLRANVTDTLGQERFNAAYDEGTELTMGEALGTDS